MKLFKTTIIIWSQYPAGSDNQELIEIAEEATAGDAYCSRQDSVEVDTETDPEWDGTDFFETLSEDDEVNDDDNSEDS